MSNQKFIFCPLGGSGEIGMNMNLYGYGDIDDLQWIIVDIGVTFADDSIPGVDLVLPDPGFIVSKKKNLLGIVLTHAHEDHIGAIAHIWPELKCNIYATPFTAVLIKEKFKEKKIDIQKNLKIVQLNGSIKLGKFNIELVTLTHSILEPNGLYIKTPTGNVLHTGDWKIDPNPLIGSQIDEKKIKKIGEEGIIAMICDSTNVFNPGRAGSEQQVRDSLYKIMSTKKNKIIVTSFASNVARMETIFYCAKKIGRKVSLVGRSMNRIFNAATQCGYLDKFEKPIDVRDAKNFKRNEIVYLCTGSQGEPNGAMNRITNFIHPDLSIEKEDTVIFSSKIIPGNEKKLYKMHNTLVQNGVEVISEENAFVHVSGHPNREDLKDMYNWSKPRSVIPVHGEHRHMVEHVNFAKEMQTPFALKVENGDIVELSQKQKPTIIDKAPSGKILLDGNVLVSEDSKSIKERKNLAFNGFLEITVIANGKGIVKKPVISFKGIPVNEEYISDFIVDLEQEIQEICRTFAINNTKQEHNLIDKIKIVSRKFFKEKTGKKPYTNVNLVRI